MSKKSTLIARRAWNILRLALLWARRGGMFRNKPVISLSVFAKIMRRLVHSDEHRGALVYGDREFSFDDTPIVHVKMHRPSSSLRLFKMPHIPCIKPHVDFDCDEDHMMSNFEDETETETWSSEDAEEEEEEEEEEEYADEAIDVKAERFIANFYEQMKLQRQISYLQNDNDCFRRGSS